MEDFPESLVAVSRPLVVLSGFDAPLRSQKPDNFKARGRRVTTESAVVRGKLSEKLLDEFFSYDGEHVSAPGKPLANNAKLISFRIKAVGRDYTLPRRKGRASSFGASPATSPSLEVQPPGTHSPLSPQCQGSPLYPDGVMTPLWPEKHQEVLPAVFVSLFNLNTDPSSDSLNDNLLKSEITSIKTTLADSQHRSRYAVILVGGDSLREAQDIEERLENIRKATKLDNKSAFYFLRPEASDTEITAFVHGVLSAFRPLCADYYGELSKHARRKRDKGRSPPASPNAVNGFAQGLRGAGWSARYAFKLGLFSEFRKETDSAIKNYSAALTQLVGQGGLFEMLSSWSPRWNEARLFADAVAIRYIRCLLTNGQPSAAVQAWKLHRKAMKSIMGTSGKGLSSYGWEAWEARFSKMMAELVRRSADLAIDANAQKAIEGVSDSGHLVYAGTEKSFTDDDQFRPWYRLHHAGYWLLMAARRTLLRRLKAETIPEEDRVPPNQSPATRVAFRSETYDTYLVPEPHIEYASAMGDSERSHELLHVLQEAETIFDIRNQLRMSVQLKLRAAQELIRVSKHSEALSILKPLWHQNSWRNGGWWRLAREISGDTYKCARETGDSESQISALWELLDSTFEPLPDVEYDLMGLLRRSSSQTDEGQSKITINVNDDNIVSFCKIENFQAIACTADDHPVDVVLSFRDAEGHAGEPVSAQLIMRSNAYSQSTSITLSSINIELEGAEPITIHHGETATVQENDKHDEIAMKKIHLQEKNFEDLTFRPHTTRVLWFDVFFKESGVVTATSATAKIIDDSYELTCVCNLQRTQRRTQSWWVLAEGGPRSVRGRIASSQINVLPKPPKVRIAFTNARPRYYTKERAHLLIEAVNEEAEEVDVKLKVEIFGNDDDENNSLWVSGEPDSGERKDLNINLGKIATGATVANESLHFQAPGTSTTLKLAITALYYLKNDPDSEISKTLSLDIDIVPPFQTSFTVKTDLHPDPWPSFFEIHDTENDAPSSRQTLQSDTDEVIGIVSRWSLKATLTSLAADTLVIERSELSIGNITGEATCTISHTDEVPTVGPGEVHQSEFLLDIRKLELPETKPTAVESSVILHWRREESNSDDTVAMEIQVPRIALPSNEPRVLATAYKTEGQENVTLGLTLENPSMHFLSFSVAMESSDDFAFSGPKLKTFHLTPLSRHTVWYSVLPFVRGQYIWMRPRVFDMYFNKSLHVHSTKNLRSHQNGISMWIDEED